MTKNLLLLAGVLLCNFASAQQKDTTKVKVRRFREYNRTLQVSLLPGISTNGIASGDYYNKFSLNLLGGASAGTTFFELGLLTNTNFKRSNGIQIGGLANLIGTNAFLNLNVSEERALINNDFECNFTGIQVGGIMNYVLDYTKGIQVAGLLNVVGRDFSGVQIAGIGNSSGGTSLGVHIAGVYNLVHESIGGIQVSTVFNYTGEELSGTQIALINKSRVMSGRRSTPPTTRRSLQVGLLNFSKEMHGTQIGLINFSRDMRGKQIGLINFFNRAGTKEPVRNGTPIGLINIGSYGSYLRLYYNELFTFNAEYTSGNCMNCTYTQSTMPYWDFNQQMNQNVVIFGYDRWRETWGFGYGFQKLLYSKNSMNPKDPENRKRMITYGARFIHLNRSLSLDKTFNILTRLNFDFGKFKWGKKYKSYYWFVGASINYYVYDDDGEEGFDVRSITLYEGTLSEYKTMLWPGYNVGLHF
jgi:hypothetical protein